MRVSKLKIILMNGPPSAGKDLAQNAFPDSVRCKFARFVKEGTHGAFGLNLIDYPMDAFETIKDDPTALFFGKSPRAAYIAYSENLMKPFTGDKQVFGKILVRWINSIRDEWSKENLPELPFIITDSGFRPEAEALVDEFGADNIILIRVRREGFYFDGDSRGYISLADLGVREFDLDNKDIEDYKRDVAEIIGGFVGKNSGEVAVVVE